ncbi:palmitoyltransferase ZDHHC12-B-like isoform X1 [Entelurus aequoreus]|uniref:palmitoyltransferase ZDHHC12-B-like isoform X1 n=1 Tax=Entelurus aequoreus TaxID=161455 RepID=UPI002B1E090E|nr:palmitoyltransferase ZDHHC12-B-like isoform X1 [Entelurus aequoreus]XP_061881142.1 palmitoyltransferase ZDHHC12-B-like isoform X1 [Entelurus aequoreus]
MVQNVFRTGFLVRAAHTLLTWVITLILFVHNTDLRQCEERGELLLPVLFFLLVVLSVLLYFAVSLMDPGFVLSDTVKASDLETESMMPQTSTARLRRCGFCLLQQPMRAKHCQTCKKCVRRFDHHCPWMENCVGERNHRWFLLYLLVQLLALLWALQVALSGISAAATWESWLRANGFLLAALCVAGVFSAVVAVLLGCHVYLVSINCTTWEFMSRHRIAYLRERQDQDNPFDRGVLCNLRDFFCACGAVAWEQVYHGNTQNPV